MTICSYMYTNSNNGRAVIIVILLAFRIFTISPTSNIEENETKTYQRPYIRRRCTPIHFICDACLGTPYPRF